MRVLVLTPVGKDFDLVRTVFQRHGIPTAPCSNLEQACRALDEGAGALMVAEEALAQCGLLIRWIDRQPAWSDLPVLLLARPGAESVELAETTGRLGNVTIIERPTRVAALASAVRSALRARSRQYQLREYLAERARTEENLRINDRRKDEFLAILAHELRNPLAPISNALHILKLTRSDNPRTAALGQMMERQVGHLKRLVNDLLEVSRVTRGDVTLQCERVELSSMVRAAVEASQPLIEASGHRFDWTPAKEPIYLYADPVRLAQIVANILNNAAKYTELGGLIALGTAREGGQAVITISDNGMGIPLEAQPKIFELFVQVEENRNRAQGGLGIGLTLAKRLAELHGGSIEVFSEGRNKGSRFTIRLPIASDGIVASATGESADAELSHVDVLIADDNHDAANSLGVLLEQLGARVHVTYGGAPALEVLDLERMNVGIIDLGMRDIDGLEVARRIRMQPASDAMTLIALTGWGQERDIRATKEAGFDLHMIKPLDLAQLLNHLRRVPKRCHDKEKELAAAIH
jgi:signal transduction histidine kinase/CheY-like chemotaxis protein